MEVLSSRILLRPSDPDRSRRFYRDTLGLVFFLGQGFLEVFGRATLTSGSGVAIWVQVRDMAAEHARLRAAGVPVLRAPRREPWGLVEMWIEDPDGVRLALVRRTTRCAVTIAAADNRARRCRSPDTPSWFAPGRNGISR